MNLYTCYSPSHKALYEEYFLPSIPSDVALITLYLPIESNGRYNNKQWIATSRKKLRSMACVIDYHNHTKSDDIIVFCDVDVQMFGPITDMVLDAMVDKDVVTQLNTHSDLPKYGMGFMAMRTNTGAGELLLQAYHTMLIRPELDGQDMFNELIVACDLRIGTFSTEQVWSPSQTWSLAMQPDLPANVVVHHANRTQSLTHKTAQLEMIRQFSTSESRTV